MEESPKPVTHELEMAEVEIAAMKTTREGVPLIPQPTNDPNEPLVRE